MLILQTLHRRLPFVKSVLVGGCAMDRKLGAKFDFMPSVISAIHCRILTFSFFRSAILFSPVDVSVFKLNDTNQCHAFAFSKRRVLAASITMREKRLLEDNNLRETDYFLIIPSCLRSTVVAKFATTRMTDTPLK